MFEKYIKELETNITQKENLKLIKKLSKEFYLNHNTDECWKMIIESYQSEYFQIQEIAVLLCGYIGNQNEDAIRFLKDEVSLHKDWRVQEVLAMSFDIYCSIIGYENSIPVIKEWISLDNPNNRRAVIEGLRVWTSRPYFKNYPNLAIQIISSLKEDDSLYVRKSVGNNLRDISKKYPELIKQELAHWDLSSKEIKQVYKLASRFIERKNRT